MKKQFSYLPKLVTLLVLITANVAFSGDRVGTGGSGSESTIVQQTYMLEDTAEKIIRFFMATPELVEEFPEVDVEKLKNLRRKIKFEVVDELVSDDQGVSRSCVNTYNEQESLIKCNLGELRNLSQRPEEYYTFVFHELLSLIKVEVTSIHHQDVSEGYRVSRRLARFVTRVGSHDLQYSRASTPTTREQWLTVRAHDYSIRLTHMEGRWTQTDGSGNIVTGTGTGKTPHNSIAGIKHQRGQRRRETRVKAIELATQSAIIRCREERPNAECRVISTLSSCKTRHAYSGVSPGRTRCTRFEDGTVATYRGPSQCKREQRREDRRAHRKVRRECSAIVQVQ